MPTKTPPSDAPHAERKMSLTMPAWMFDRLARAVFLSRDEEGFRRMVKIKDLRHISASEIARRGIVAEIERIERCALLGEQPYPPFSAKTDSTLEIDEPPDPLKK